MKELRKIILDLIPVLFGVLLALLINNYREGVKQNKLRTNNIEQVSSRIEKSIRQVEIAINNHELLSETIMSTKEEEINLMQLLMKVDGFKVANVRSISGNFNGFSPEDFKISLEVEDVVSQKQMMKKSEVTLTTLFYDNINESPWKIREKIYFQIQALLHLERELLGEYNELLLLLDTEKSK